MRNLRPYSAPPKRLWLLRVYFVVLLLLALFAYLNHGLYQAGSILFVGTTAAIGLGHSPGACFGEYTQIQDIIQPSIWLPWTVQRSVELSELVTAGIIDVDPQYSRLADEGGATANMPFWNDLDGEDEVLSDQNPLSTGKITSSQDVAAMHNRGKAWKHNDLAAVFSGEDPAAVAADLVGTYWARRYQAMTLATLKGVFSIASMASHLHSIYAATGAVGVDNYLDGLQWINASQKLGDRKDSLTAAIMHSAVEASLAKQDLIEWVPDSQGGARIRTFQGKRIIIDDGMPVEVINSANVYTTYMFGRGAIALGNSAKYAQNRPEGGLGTWGAEFFREALAGNSGLITRRRFIIHPRGIKWLAASQAGSSATNPELGTAGNWVRVFDPKLIPMVAVQHNIAA